MSLAQAPIADLVARLPDTDEPGKESTFTGPEPAEAQKTFEEVLSGGPESIQELVSLLRASTDPDFNDYRAEYLLHGLVVQAAQSGKEALRAMLSATLAQQIGRGELSKGVRGCLIRELRWIADEAAVEALARQLADEDLSIDAVASLTAIGPAAAPALRAALPSAKGRARLAIVQALGTLTDTAAADALREAARDQNVDVRIAATWALANIADAASADLLLKTAESAQGWERIQAVKSCLVLAEKLITAGKKPAAAKLYARLRETHADPSEQYIREAAERGLTATQ